MSVNFQDSNVMLAAVRATSRSKRTTAPRRASRVVPAAWDFASLLSQDEAAEVVASDVPEVLRGLPSLTNTLPLDPALYMQQLYGREFDPSTGRVNHAVFLERTQEKAQSFVEMFAETLSQAGLDGSSQIALMVNELGQVEASEHTQALAITGLFAQNRDLAQSYREVAEAHHWAALTEIGSSYVESWYSAEDFGQKEDIAEQFRVIFDTLADCASQMTYHAGDLNSISVSTALSALDALHNGGPVPASAEGGEVRSGEDASASSPAA